MLVTVSCFDKLLYIAHQLLKNLPLVLIDRLNLLKLPMQLLKRGVKLLLVHCRKSSGVEIPESFV